MMRRLHCYDSSMCLGCRHSDKGGTLLLLSHDKERGQAAVQHILRDQHGYSTGGWRWDTAKGRCEEVSPGRAKVWVEDKYYTMAGPVVLLLAAATAARR
jgi:hypothetical protein